MSTLGDILSGGSSHMRELGAITATYYATSSAEGVSVSTLVSELDRRAIMQEVGDADIRMARAILYSSEISELPSIGARLIFPTGSDLVGTWIVQAVRSLTSGDYEAQIVAADEWATMGPAGRSSRRI